MRGLKWESENCETSCFGPDPLRENKFLCDIHTEKRIERIEKNVKYVKPSTNDTSTVTVTNNFHRSPSEL